MGEKWVKVGAVMSAVKMYEEMGELENVVECLAQADRTKEAKEAALAMKDFHSNPKVLCIFAEISEDHTYFKKAWKVSNKKYARAIRSLARYYFYTGDTEKAIRNFKKVYCSILLTLVASYQLV